MAWNEGKPTTLSEITTSFYVNNNDCFINRKKETNNLVEAVYFAAGREPRI